MNTSVDNFQHVSIVGAAAPGLGGQRCESRHICESVCGGLSFKASCAILKQSCILNLSKILRMCSGSSNSV